MGWLDVAWTYRKSHTIVHATGAGTNYQMCIKVYKGSGTDNTETVDWMTVGKVYLNNHCKDDFGDIRFTSSDESTLLDYWMQEYVSGSYAIFWVEIAADISSSDATIYIYYGNDSATSISDIQDTMLFGDDFSEDSGVDWTTRWQSNNESLYAIVNGELEMTAPNPLNTSKCICSKVKPVGCTHLRYRCGDNITAYFCKEPTAKTYTGKDAMNLSRKNGIWYFIINTNREDVGEAIGTNSYRAYYLDTGSGNIVEKGYRLDGTLVKTKTDAPASHDVYNLMFSWDTVGLKTQYKYIFTRKYIATEPTHGSWGLEESTTGIKNYFVDVVLKSLNATKTFGLDVQLASTWLTGWGRRKSHTVAQTAGAGANYQVAIKVYKGSGTDGTETHRDMTIGKVYCGGNCRDDFGDIRFTQREGSIELSYWIETGTLVSGTSAVFWVKVTEDLDVSDAVIQMYYDNPPVTTTSSISNTFIFGDDFTTLDASVWDLAAGVGTITQSGTEVELKQSGVAGGYPSMRSKTAYNPLNTRWESKLKWHTADAVLQSGFSARNGNNGDRLFFWLGYAHNPNTDSMETYLDCDGGGCDDVWSVGVITLDRDYVLSGMFKTGLNRCKRYSSAESDSHDYVGKSFASDITLKMILGFYVYNYGTNAYTWDLLVDWAFVRKWTSTEPTHGTWGGETQINLTLAYNVDVVLKRITTKPYNIDIILKTLGVAKPYIVDTLLKKLGLTTSYDVDVALKKLALTKSHAIDAVFKKLGLIESHDVDVVLKKLGLTESHDIDVVLKKLGLTKSHDVDVVLKKLNVIKSYDVDVILAQHDVLSSYGLDVILETLAIEGAKGKQATYRTIVFPIRDEFLTKAKIPLLLQHLEVAVIEIEVPMVFPKVEILGKIESDIFGKDSMLLLTIQNPITFRTSSDIAYVLSFLLVHKSESLADVKSKIKPSKLDRRKKRKITLELLDKD